MRQFFERYGRQHIANLAHRWTLHLIEELLLALTLCQSTTNLKESVGQCALAVVDVRDD